MSDETRTSFPTITRVANVVDNPITKLLDRLLMWAVVGLCALMVIGGKTWLNGYIGTSPPVDSLRQSVGELVTIQKQATVDIQNLTTNVRLLTQESAFQEKRIDRLESTR